MDASAPSATLPASANPRHRWLACVLVVLATLVGCWGTVGLGWTNWDDGSYVYENAAVTSGDVSKLWTQATLGGYTPLTVSTFALEWNATSDAASLSARANYFHMDNLLLHLLCTGLVFWILSRLGLGLPWAVVGALLFGLHPMHVESFAWISERKDVLYGAFYLAAILAYLRYQDTEKWPWLALVAALMVLSLLSKIMAVTLPLSMLLLDMYRGRASGKRWLLEKVPFLMVALVAGILQLQLMGEAGTLDKGSTHGFLNRIFLGGGVFGRYLGKFIFPANLSPVYPVPDPVTWVEGLFALLGIGVLGVALLYRRRWPWLTFGILFFLANVLFLLQFLGGGIGYLADRYTYIAYLGLIFVAVKALESLANGRIWGKYVAWGIAAFGVAACAWLTRPQIQVWQDSGTLWTRAIAAHPHDALAYGKRADHYLSLGKTAQAQQDYEAARQRDPDEPRYVLALGHLHYLGGDSVAALHDFRAVVAQFAPLEQADWDNDALRLAVFNQGVLHAGARRLDSAMVAYDLLLTHLPDDTLALINRAAIHFERGAYRLAAADYEAVIEHCVVDGAYQAQLGQCYMQLAEPARAVTAYTAAIGGAPADGKLYVARAQAYRAMGDQGSALADARKAQSLGVALDSTWISDLP